VKITVDGNTKYTDSSGIVTYSLSPGSHSITAEDPTNGRPFSHFWDHDKNVDCNQNDPLDTPSNPYTFTMASCQRTITVWYKVFTYIKNSAGQKGAIDFDGSKISGYLLREDDKPLHYPGGTTIKLYYYDGSWKDIGTATASPSNGYFEIAWSCVSDATKIKAEFTDSSWYYVSSSGEKSISCPPPTTTPSTCPSEPTYPSDKWDRVWCDKSFNTKLSDTPDQPSITFDDNWDTSIVEGIRADDIGFRSGRTINLPVTGTYTFEVGSDDGVRVWIDGELVLDKWYDRGYTVDRFTKDLTAGNHRFRIDYYENTVGARVYFNYIAPTTTTTSTSSTTTSTTTSTIPPSTTTLPPPPPTIECKECYARSECECEFKGNCEKGVWYLEKKEKNPINTTIIPLPPSTIQFTPQESGKILIQLGCFSPLGSYSYELEVKEPFLECSQVCKVGELCECRVNGCANGRFTALFKSTIIKRENILTTSYKASFIPQDPGIIEVEAFCLAPIKTENTSIVVVEEKKPETTTFENFRSRKEESKHRVMLDYENNLLEPLIIVFTLSKEGEAINEKIEAKARTQDTALAVFDCKTLGLSGTYTVSWKAFKSSDKQVPIAWSKVEDLVKITC